MNIRGILRRTSAFVLAVLLAFTAMPISTYSADEVEAENIESQIMPVGDTTDEITLTVNVDKNKATVVLQAADADTAEIPNEEVSDTTKQIYTLDSSKEYTLKITSINSTDKIVSVKDGTDTDVTGMADDQLSFTEIISSPANSIVRTIAFEETVNTPATYSYEVTMDSTKGVIVITDNETSKPVNPIIVENVHTYELTSGKFYTMSITAEGTEVIDTVGDVVVENTTYTKNDLSISENTSVEIKFYTDIKFSLTTDIPRSNGATVVLKDGADTIVNSTSTDTYSYADALVKKGSYTLTITTAAGQTLTSASLGGNPIAFEQNGNVYAYTFTEVTDDLSLNVTFAQTRKVMIAGNALSMGTIYANEQEVTGNELIVADGASVTFKLTPPSGEYYLSKITENTEESGKVTFENGIYTYTTGTITEDTTIGFEYTTVPPVNVAYNDPTAAFSWVYSNANDKDMIVENTDSIKSVLTNGASLTLSKAGSKIKVNGEGQFVDSIAYTEDARINSITVYTPNDSTLLNSVVTYVLNKPVDVIVDEKIPTMTNLTTENLWIGKKAGVNTATFSVSATAAQTEITKVVYLTEEKDITNDYATILSSGIPVEKDGNGNYTITSTYTEGMTTTTYWLYAINQSGVMNKISKTINVDATNPIITSVQAKDETKFWDKLFTKSDVFEITVSATDDAGVGVDKVTLVLSNEDGKDTYELELDAEGKAVFNQIRLKDGKTYSISVTATDKLGNVCDAITAIDDGKNNSFTTFQVDKVTPTLNVTPAKAEYHPAGTNKYYVDAQDYSIPFEATDSIAGIQRYEVLINDVPIISNTSSDYVTEITDSVNISAATDNEKGVYNVVFKVTDAAGNVKTETVVVYVDDEVPKIDCIVVSANKIVEDEENEKTIKYCYFGQVISFKVKATDVGYADSSASASGVDGIQFYFVKEDGTKVEPENNYARLDENGNVTITRNEDFVGRLYVSAVDHMNKESKYTETDLFIVETEATHTSNSVVNNITKGTSYTDINGFELYVNDTSVDVKIEDTISGIAQVDWKLSVPLGATTTGSIVVNPDKTITDTTWKVTEEKENLVTKMEGNIPVSANSNAIQLEVTLTDNAGNTKTASKQISIDKTKPEVEITYDSTVSGGHYTNGRTAIITVYERNFDSTKVSSVITNTDNTIPALSKWKTVPNASNPDKTAHTATVTFAADGDYNMTVNVKDKGNLPADEVKMEEFTVDKTAPTVTVTFDNNDGLNEMYYSAQRTATITVNEHNFDSDKVTIEGQATDNGVATTFPSVSGWSTSGDTHTASLVFNNDAHFKFDITVTDIGGNSVQQSVAEFAVDTTIPEIVFSNIEENSANSGEVAPVITFTDTNYDENGVTVELVGANQGSVEEIGSFSATESGQVFTFANFAEEQEYDDIYTLSATITDLAGNMFEDEISFSVNRFGSVYVLGDELAAINGKYVKEAVDVVITETNVDGLDLDTVKVVLTVNGTPKTLVRGEEYTISQTGGGGSWSQYEYRIGKEMFKEDGSYSIAIYSVDDAGNVNENIHESKEAEVFFGIDTVNPIITTIDLESGKTYEATTHNAVISITDNLVLADVNITVNGESVEYTVNGADYTFVLNESNEAQTIVITVTDQAGNVATMTFEDVWVTTNAFVRVMNSPVAVAVGAGSVGVAGVGGGVAIFLRRKNIIKVKRR